MKHRFVKCALELHTEKGVGTGLKAMDGGGVDQGRGGSRRRCEEVEELDCLKSKDIRAASKARWPGLKDLAKGLCGLNMLKPKHVCMSNWEARVLSEAQVEYACIDAFASYKIGLKLTFEV
ncbi:hypothetical protein SASPL_105737 [Salvia splendens]|uniref:3'-5' exonuclease domain-containing protein n=1 Tax=Salvia splendens TaxID=180675 RepID=A0A8X8YJK7_SALSN|nr:hypothetical protein SASPL_105737 [Salvia splendens]